MNWFPHAKLRIHDEPFIRFLGPMVIDMLSFISTFVQSFLTTVMTFVAMISAWLMVIDGYDPIGVALIAFWLIMLARLDRRMREI